jgi:hypothetical protein
VPIIISSRKYCDIKMTAIKILCLINLNTKSMSKTARRFAQRVQWRCAKSLRRERRELRLVRLNRRKVAGGLQPTQGYHQQRATPNLLSSFVQTIRRRLERRRWRRTYIYLARTPRPRILCAAAAAGPQQHIIFGFNSAQSARHVFGLLQI